MFERLRSALRAALDAATPPADLFDLASQMREAVIHAKAGLAEMRESLEKSERELALERRELETAQRRHDLAAGIEDHETVEVAERFVAKHAERVAVLERKAAAQREEIALAERELAEMTAQLAQVTKNRAGIEAERSADAAWAGLGAAGMDRPELDAEAELLKARMDRAAREKAAEAQLEELKRKMGKQ